MSPAAGVGIGEQQTAEPLKSAAVSLAAALSYIVLEGVTLHSGSTKNQSLKDSSVQDFNSAGQEEKEHEGGC